MIVKRHEDLPGWGPSPARHGRIRQWCREQGLPVPPGQATPDIERAYIEATGDTE